MKNRFGKFQRALIGILFLMPLLYVCISAWRAPTEIKSSVGQYPNRQAEERAALKRLSQLLKQYPHITTFKVYGNYPDLRPDGTLIYRRGRNWRFQEENRLSVDQRPTKSPRILTFTYAAIDDDIHAIAEKSGVVQDVYDRVLERAKRLDNTR
jgi:hypothetical protein